MGNAKHTLAEAIPPKLAQFTFTDMPETEKLQRIKSRCEELLALAEKRTPGWWKSDDTIVISIADIHGDIVCDIPSEGECSIEYWPGNRAYIAACAGAAEAGWRATIAAIEWLQEMNKAGRLTKMNYESLVITIASAFQEELL